MIGLGTIYDAQYLASGGQFQTPGNRDSKPNKSCKEEKEICKEDVELKEGRKIKYGSRA